MKYKKCSRDLEAYFLYYYLIIFSQRFVINVNCQNFILKLREKIDIENHLKV